MRPAYDVWSQDGALREGHSSTRVNMARRLWGSCEEVKRPACDGVVDQRVSKLRPSCLKSYAAGMGRRSECAMRLSHKWEVVNRTALSR